MTAMERIKEIKKLAESHDNGILFHADNKFGIVSAGDVPFLLQAFRVMREIAIQSVSGTGVCLDMSAGLSMENSEAIDKIFEDGMSAESKPDVNHL